MNRILELSQFVNLCDGHPVIVMDKHDNRLLVVQPSGKIAHVQRRYAHVDWIQVDGQRIELVKMIPGATTGLPEEDFHHIFLVSRIVKHQFPDRDDVWVPGEKIKDSCGGPLGCKQLCL
jgi:hypothetical protein